MIAPQTIRSVFNNDYASAVSSGDPRQQMKQYDRGGLSRGAGQSAMAATQGAQRMAEGIAQAYSNRQASEDFNNATSMQNAQQDQSQQMALSGLLQQQQYDQMMAEQQRKNNAMNFATSILGGLLN